MADSLGKGLNRELRKNREWGLNSHKLTQTYCTSWSVRLHAKISWAMIYSSIRPFNWTTVLVPVYKSWVRINLLLNSATGGGDISRSAGCCWAFFQLAKQATNKLASGWRNLYWMVKTWTTLLTLYLRYKFNARFPLCLRDSCFLPGFPLQIYTVRVPGQRPLWELSIMRRTLRPVRVRLWQYPCRSKSTLDCIMWVC